MLVSVAAENNLSEAFFRASRRQLRIALFTPQCEVKLCGHATLASAFVIMERGGEIVVRDQK
jgi:predicted PhzF superfamily epimerase YddE/YHI9